MIKSRAISVDAILHFLKIIIPVLLLFARCNKSPTLVRHVPVIENLLIHRGIVCPGEYTDVEIVASDEDDQEELSYLWRATCGEFVNPHNPHTQWWAPTAPDTCTISVSVRDHYFTVSDSCEVQIISCQ